MTKIKRKRRMRMRKFFRERATRTRQPANLAAPLCMPWSDIYFNRGIANGFYKALVALVAIFPA